MADMVPLCPNPVVSYGKAALVGTLGGRSLGARFGTRMAVIGGVVLIAIGAWIVLEHVVLS